jgi:hypothetical protein
MDKNRSPGMYFTQSAKKTFKAKSKAKPVTINLKKINIVNDEKVNRVNKAFVNMQKESVHFEPLREELIPQEHIENEPINVDEVTRLMAQL